MKYPLAQLCGALDPTLYALATLLTAKDFPINISSNEESAAPSVP